MLQVLLPRRIEALEGLRVEQIACAPTNTLALASDGCAYSWGNGQQSRLGHGEHSWWRTASPSLFPVEVAFKDRCKTSGLRRL